MYLRAAANHGNWAKALRVNYWLDSKACAAALNDYRTREGRELCLAILEELNQLEAGTAQIQQVRAKISAALYQRLRERVQVLLMGSSVPDARIAEEVAVLADRSDVQEELTRVSVHAGELRRMLQTGGEVGNALIFCFRS